MFTVTKAVRRRCAARNEMMRSDDMKEPGRTGSRGQHGMRELL
jgi:hypothetical protein